MKKITQIGKTPFGYEYSNGMTVVAERPKWDSKLTSEENFAKLEEEPKFWTVKVETSPGDSEDVFSGTFEECEKFVLNSK